jgi:RNA polymerase sigma-70 factor, ECF subfamily
VPTLSFYVLLVLCALASVALVPELDRDLARRIAGGDTAALKSLYERVRGRALGIALRILGDRSDAEDVVQETFVEAWKRAHEYEERRGSLEGWIVTIARSRAIDRHRARARARRLAGRVEEETAGGARFEFPAEAFDASFESARVARALDDLPSDQRRVIDLAYFEGLSQSEIAARIEEPLGTVKTRTRLAMAKLAKALLDVGAAS